jgi:alkylhydroperoxidase/carboxymuconolactone decarboxylase family protein YurZ
MKHLLTALLLEALTQRAFYAGWPSAVSAAGVARAVFSNQP